MLNPQLLSFVSSMVILNLFSSDPHVATTLYAFSTEESGCRGLGELLIIGVQQQITCQIELTQSEQALTAWTTQPQ